MDYLTPFLSWLMACPYVASNKLFAAAAEAKDGALQVVSQQVNRSEDREYVDGSVLHRVLFTVFDHKNLAFSRLVAQKIEADQNVDALLDTTQLIEWVDAQNKNRNFPTFGARFEVQRVYTSATTPSTPALDMSSSPTVARYSVPVVCEVLEWPV